MRATTVTVPLEAPLRHSNGAHWGRFVRTIVEVETDEGSSVSARWAAAARAPSSRSRRCKPLPASATTRSQLEALRFKICNPTAALYNNRTQLHAAIEFACLDICRAALGVPVYDLLGGRLRDEVRVRQLPVLPVRRPATASGEVRTPEQLVAHARELKDAHGFTTHKLKGGVYPPDYELECYRALAEAFPGDGLRYDPNARCRVERGDPLRPGDRGPRQRLLRGPDLGPERHAPGARGGRSRSPPTRWSSTSSSSRPTCSTRRSTRSCWTRRSGAASAPA